VLCSIVIFRNIGTVEVSVKRLLKVIEGHYSNEEIQ